MGEITVVLQREVVIDEGGTPVQSTWVMEAFGHSEEAKRKLTMAVQDDPSHPLNQEDSTFITEEVPESKSEDEAKEHQEEKGGGAKAEDKAGGESKQAESKG